MNYYTAFLIIASAFAESSLPTFTSTIISSTECSSCQVVPSSFAYSNSSIAQHGAAPASASAEGDSTILEYETAYDDDVSTVVKTVCNSQGACYLNTQTTHDTVTTKFVDGVLTVITYSDSASATQPTTTASETDGSGAVTKAGAAGSDASTVTLADTTVVTITSCKDDKCVTTAETQVLTTKTDTVDGELTIYTTYCPLSTETPATKAPATTEAPVSKAPVIEKVGTTVITVTSCSENKCSKVAKTTGVTVVTENHTVYTTYCPLTEEKKPESTIPPPAPTSVAPTTTDVHTTVITVTSCADNKCSEVPKTTGVTVITENETIYTTFCPLTTETKPAPVPTSEKPAPVPTTETKPAPVPTTKSEATTINVITNNIVTETPKTTIQQQTTSTPLITTPAVSTFAGAGSIIRTSVVGVIFSLFFMAL